jgi:hypothetical protein
MKIYLENFLEFNYMHENKILFYFLKRKINLKVLGFFFRIFEILRNILKKTKYFNIIFISYSINRQSDIIQN